MNGGSFRKFLQFAGISRVFLYFYAILVPLGTNLILICFCPINEIENGYSGIFDGFNPLSDIWEELGTYFL